MSIGNLLPQPAWRFVDDQYPGLRVYGIRSAYTGAAMTRRPAPSGYNRKPHGSLTAGLVERVMGWGIGPDRFLLDKRRWLPRWRFQPERNLVDAFQLLEQAKPGRYEMGSEKNRDFWVRVQIAGVAGEACHTSKPKAITVAVARALGIDTESITSSGTESAVKPAARSLRGRRAAVSC